MRQIEKKEEEEEVKEREKESKEKRDLGTHGLMASKLSPMVANLFQYPLF